MNNDEKMELKKKVLIVIACILALIGIFCKIKYPDSDINNQISDIQEIVIDEIKKDVVVSNYTESEATDTIQATIEGESVETVEVIESNFEEENELENQIESDAIIEEQENISYDGDITGNGLSLLGAYQGLTYYSQADSRWASVPYTSTGNSKQTMKSSACRSNFGCNGCI